MTFQDKIIFDEDHTILKYTIHVLSQFMYQLIWGSFIQEFA